MSEESPVVDPWKVPDPDRIVDPILIRANRSLPVYVRIGEDTCLIVFRAC